MNAIQDAASGGAQARRLLSVVIRGAFVLYFILHPSSFILAKQPAFFEPSAHYYKARGFGVGVRWEVPQPKVEEGRDLSATLVITRVEYPVDVEKPDLSKIPKFAERFLVTDAPDPIRNSDDKEVRFTYKLRPRNRTVTQVPALDFYYLSLAAAPSTSPFRFTRADSVPITVTDPPPKPIVPMWEADPLFHITTGPGVLETPFIPCKWAWMAAALFGPLMAFGWFLAWRRIFPDAAQLAKLRQSRMARRAIDTIRKAKRAPDPPATIATAVLGYLRMRFPLPESAVTPSEIAAALSKLHIPPAVAEETADVFRACDRARFAPPSDSGVSLAENAEATITRLEDIA